MNISYLVPFSYFARTRLAKGSISFHAIFEWGAAVLLVVTVGAGEVVESLLMGALSYLAFISLYEIGYLFNDLVSSRQEEDGRRRGPQDAAIGWIAAWCLARIAIFLAVTAAMGAWARADWWKFFAALSLTFAVHDFLKDRELKVITFSSLAWFRFMAPVMFAVRQQELLGIGLAASATYVLFRTLGYMDSKGVLAMPSRRTPGFRAFVFAFPMMGVLAIWPLPGSQGYAILTSYFAIAAIAGSGLIARRGGERS